MVKPKTYLITGGAGFIGSALIRELINHTQHRVINVDKLTYAGNLGSLSEVSANSRYHFIKADICDSQVIQAVFDKYQPDIVMHLAAESHVDRSIHSPKAFMETNVMGTFILLEATRIYWQSLQLSDGQKAKDFRFHHVSTDEIYGSLSEDDSLFLESTAYAPSSPYSASKASSNHLVRAWQRTYELPTLITNCSNNYGPYQFPEKLIPLVILNALAGKPLPVYGNGEQVRDWLYVEDHARALITVANEGKVGDTYNIGGHNEKRNIDVVKALCALLDELVVQKPSGISRFDRLITFVADRPGHDTRYAIDASKIAADLNWAPNETFETGLRKTVLWYLNNKSWWRQVQAGQHHTP